MLLVSPIPYIIYLTLRYGLEDCIPKNFGEFCCFLLFLSFSPVILVVMSIPFFSWIPHLEGSANYYDHITSLPKTDYNRIDWKEIRKNFTNELILIAPLVSVIIIFWLM